MMKFTEFREEFKKELDLYCRENQIDLFQSAIGVVLGIIMVAVAILFAIFTKVMLCLSLCVVIILLCMIGELKIYNEKEHYTYHKYHLLKDIKFFCFRLICYPCGITIIGLLIWIIFK